MVYGLADICNNVIDGDSFYTKRNVWIKLARVRIPENDPGGHYRARQLLSGLITNATIHYQQADTSYNRQIVAEVWHNGRNINDYLIQLGYH